MARGARGALGFREGERTARTETDSGATLDTEEGDGSSSETCGVSNPTLRSSVLTPSTASIVAVIDDAPKSPAFDASAARPIQRRPTKLSPMIVCVFIGGTVRTLNIIPQLIKNGRYLKIASNSPKALLSDSWKGGRVVYGGGLENR